ncbi:hypothetical protein HanRHA438_Chr05g0244571 [Helianthus annuus]|nr:hypothetical protein HanRHA438_Chr05g0244571 [Helianthus annuus]
MVWLRCIKYVISYVIFSFLSKNKCFLFLTDVVWLRCIKYVICHVIFSFFTFEKY